MTLGVWFKTYVFYPVSVSPFMRKWNKFGKAHAGKYMTKLVGSAIALFPVWLFNGLWHGPQWNYIFYGMYYFVILLLEVALEPLKEHFYAKTGVSEETHWWNVLRIAKTWLIIFTGELFFRANTLTAGFAMFASIFKEFAPQRLWDGTLLRMGLDVADYVVIVMGCIVVGVIGHLREDKSGTDCCYACAIALGTLLCTDFCGYFIWRIWCGISTGGFDLCRILNV